MPLTAPKNRKITTSHTTMTEASAEVVQLADKHNEVTKISVGIIKQVGGGRRSIKFLPIVGGILAKVRGNGAVQEVFIYTKLPEMVNEHITQNFPVSSN